MKKNIITKLLSIILILICFCLLPSNGVKANASNSAPDLTQFYINSFFDNNSTLYNPSQIPTITKANFPLIINTTQVGLGNMVVWCNGSVLSSSYYKITSTPIISNGIVTGYNSQVQINFNSTKMWTNFYNEIELRCLGNTVVLKDSI